MSELTSYAGFNWESLPADSLVIDVGCGNGSQILKIAKKNSKLKFIAQDRSETISQVTKPVLLTPCFHETRRSDIVTDMAKHG
jgi:ubiquinone/menaquinone biosynthesis C-methylase UbiE